MTQIALLLHIIPAFIVQKRTEKRTKYAANATILKEFAEIAPRPITTTDLKICNNDNREIKLQMTAYRQLHREHYSFVFRQTDVALIPKIRLHSSCFTGDLMRSVHCDCYSQLHGAIDRISSYAGGGAIIYLNQEGRNIGLSNKMRAYALQQQQQLDTVEANCSLGLPIDGRNFKVAAQILQMLGLTKIILLSNNPQKRLQLQANGIEVVAMEELITSDDDRLRRYYMAKAQKLNHNSRLQHIFS